MRWTGALTAGCTHRVGRPVHPSVLVWYRLRGRDSVSAVQPRLSLVRNIRSAIASFFSWALERWFFLDSEKDIRSIVKEVARSTLNHWRRRLKTYSAAAAL